MSLHCLQGMPSWASWLSGNHCNPVPLQGVVGSGSLIRRCLPHRQQQQQQNDRMLAQPHEKLVLYCVKMVSDPHRNKKVNQATVPNSNLYLPS